MLNHDLTEMRYQLKYFYLIDIDNILKDLEKYIQSISPINAESSSDTLDEVFETIFERIVSASNNYTTFICEAEHYSSTSFFGEPRFDAYFTGLLRLVRHVLKNNCIIHSFLGLIHSDSDTLEINGNNAFVIRNGFFAENGFSDIAQYLPTDSDLKRVAQTRYYQHKNRYYGLNDKEDKKNTTQNGPSYSSQIIHNINESVFSSNSEESLSKADEFSSQADESSSQTENISAEKKDKYPAPQTPACFSHLINYLYENNKVAFFNKRLIKETTFGFNLTTAYNDLYQSYLSTQFDLESNLDQLLFDIEMNSIYGFSFFNAMIDVFQEMNTCIPSPNNPKASPNKRELKLLKGDAFLKIIHSAAELPIYHNKQLFVKYALESFKKSESLYAPYLSKGTLEKRLFSYLDASTQPMEDTARGLLLLDSYFLILRNITIPLLYALWDVTLHFLFNKQDLKDIYSYYLNTNSDFITFDYSTITEDDITNFGSKYVHFYRMDESIANLKMLFKKYQSQDSKKKKAQIDIITTLNNPNAKKEVKNLAKKNEIFNVIPYELDSDIQQIICDAIKIFCNANSVTTNRFPYFTVTKGTTYNPIGKIIPKLLPIEPSSKRSPNREVRSFQTAHAVNLNSYIFLRHDKE